MSANSPERNDCGRLFGSAVLLNSGGAVLERLQERHRAHCKRNRESGVAAVEQTFSIFDCPRLLANNRGRLGNKGEHTRLPPVSIRQLPSRYGLWVRRKPLKTKKVSPVFPVLPAKGASSHTAPSEGRAHNSPLFENRSIVAGGTA